MKLSIQLEGNKAYLKKALADIAESLDDDETETKESDPFHHQASWNHSAESLVEERDAEDAREEMNEHCLREELMRELRPRFSN